MAVGAGVTGIPIVSAHGTVIFSLAGRGLALTPSGAAQRLKSNGRME
jgi:hypothetical protein